MNALLGSVTRVSCVINNLLKNGGNISRGFKSDLKIKWFKPTKIPSHYPDKSGDGGLECKAASASDLAAGYANSEELKNASDLVKKLFSLEFMPIKETESVNREKVRDLVKRHDHDRGSMETRIAMMTSEILYLQEYNLQHPRNKIAQVFLKELIDKRKKFLTKLRRWDYKRFEWILEKLNLTYKPYPLEYYRVTRKDSMRKLTTKHCEKLRQDKLDSYKAELHSKQKDFYRQKAERLEFIRNEEIACGIEPSVSEEQIKASQEKAATFQ